MKTILHIVNDFSGSSVYKNLFLELDSRGYRQIIYTAIRDQSLVGVNRFEFTISSSTIIYSKILNKHFDRVFYKNKISKIAADIENKVDLSSVDLVHAHTWYSDGGVALMLNRIFKIPYIIAVRSTDLNFFHKYYLHLHRWGSEILRNSCKIIFISVCYKNTFERHFNSMWIDKSQLIPNGIENIWLDNFKHKVSQLPPVVKILYVGQFIPRKKVRELVHAVELINKNGVLVELSLVGKATSYSRSLKLNSKSNIKYVSQITDKKSLIELFRSHHIFAMPSVNETFGLVYIEALTQGLPILFTKEDGIDGFYSNIGESVSKEADAREIADGLISLIANYQNYFFDQLTLDRNHRWKGIANVFGKIYDSIQ